MGVLLQMPTFWFGAVIFLLSQFGRFCELSAASRTTLFVRSNIFSQLKPRDLTDSRTFASALFVFLLVSAFGYLLLCLVPPSVISGWLTITNTPVGNFAPADMSSYPLFVSAALIGLTQPIPGFDKIANLQKEVFHQWIGVPERVVGTAAYFAVQILARRSDQGLTAEINRLVSDRWTEEIGAFADVTFYVDHIKRVELDSENALVEVKKGSVREKKFVIQDLIFAACVAAVKREGGRALEKLAEALDVKMPPRIPTRMSRVSSGILLAMFCSVFLWFFLPLTGIREFVEAAVGPSNPVLWPTTLYFSGTYVLTNFVPTILGTLILLLAITQRKKPRKLLVPEILDRYATTILGIALLVICYDYLEALVERSASTVRYQDTAGIFFATRIPFFAFHSLIAALAAAVLLVYTVRGDLRDTPAKICAWGMGLVVSLGILSYFYAEARLQYHLGVTSRDFVVAVVLLNALSALVSFAIASLALRRSAEPAPSAMPSAAPTVGS
ncbi:hypothetical protein [Rhizobium sp. BK251]|uniref:hypothetical protein n=1 Tax=Rhizobium sp. BK251 TaxID=2512125 RepID=UPI001049D306|nr:hypothetical protein [Rhizobium sp. BK251]TCL71231.1 hypothetical protein EV286_106204 [Rhizobium sp. BK251]